MRPRRQVAAAIAASLFVVGCSAQTGPLQERTAPEFRVTGTGQEVVVPAWSYCVPGACADGAPPDEPPSVGRARTVRVAFSRPGWSVSADVLKAGVACARKYAVALIDLGDARWELGPTGPAGAYEVRLSAVGPEGGSANATIHWTATEDGTVAAQPCDR